MAVELIEGRVDAAQPRRQKGKYGYFDTLTFHDSSGAERRMAKVCAAGEVLEVLKRGGGGRFYLSSFGGQTGVHGVRMDDGTAAYSHYNNMEMIVLIGVAAGAVMAAIGLAGASGFMITPVIIGAALAVAYVFMRKSRMDGRRQYEADAAAPVPPA